MPLNLPKDGIKQEELNSWLIDTKEKFDKMEIELEQKTTREKELLNENNKLYSRITGKKEETKEENNKKEDIPDCVSEEMYNKFDDVLKEELKEILNNGDDE